MDTQVERWFEAIGERRSRRSFRPDPVHTELLDALQTHCDAYRPFADARVVLVREAPERLYRVSGADSALLPRSVTMVAGIMGAYGRVTGAPSALAIVGRKSPHVQEHAGYTGEAAVLEAAALGLDTCWVGGFFSPSVTAGLVDLVGDELVLAVSPIGHALTRHTRKERLVFRTGEQPKKRLRLEHIALGLIAKDWPGWAIAGVRAAQRAPSAVNRQPWRFRLHGDGVALAYHGADQGFISKRLDCGIAMLHFELGVLHSGRSGRWEPPGPGAGEADVACWRPGAPG